MIKTFLKLAFIALALFLVFNKISPELILQTISQISPLAFVFAFITLLGSQLISGLRLHYYLNKNEVRLNKGDSISLYLATTFLNIFLPSGIGGDGVKVLHISNKFHKPKLRVLQIALSERASGLYLLLMVIYLLLPFMPSFNQIPYCLYLYIASFIIYNICYFLGISYFLKESVSTALGAASYSSFIQLLSFISASSILLSLAPEVDLSSYLVLFGLSSIAAILPFSIGGIGLRELTFLSFAPLIGLDATLGVSFCLIYFTVNLLVSALGGVFVTKHLGYLSKKA